MLSVIFRCQWHDDVKFYSLFAYKELTFRILFYVATIVFLGWLGVSPTVSRRTEGSLNGLLPALQKEIQDMPG